MDAFNKLFQDKLKEKHIGPDQSKLIEQIFSAVTDGTVDKACRKLYELGIVNEKIEDLNLLQDVLTQCKDEDGQLHSHAVHGIGNMHRIYGSHKVAEKVLLRALRKKLEKWGPNHASTLDTMNALGNLYVEFNVKRKKAEKTLQDTLKGREQLDPDSISTLNTMYSLGVFYKNNNKLKEGEDVLKEAVNKTEKICKKAEALSKDILTIQGCVYARGNEIEKAKETFLAAMDKPGPNSEILLNAWADLDLLLQQPNSEIIVGHSGSCVFKRKEILELF